MLLPAEVAAAPSGEEQDLISITFVCSGGTSGFVSLTEGSAAHDAAPAGSEAPAIATSTPLSLPQPTLCACFWDSEGGGSLAWIAMEDVMARLELMDSLLRIRLDWPASCWKNSATSYAGHHGFHPFCRLEQASQLQRHGVPAVESGAVYGKPERVTREALEELLHDVGLFPVGHVRSLAVVAAQRLRVLYHGLDVADEQRLVERETQPGSATSDIRADLVEAGDLGEHVLVRVNHRHGPEVGCRQPLGVAEHAGHLLDDVVLETVDEDGLETEADPGD
ncbi:hypothetical protein MRX96_039844 [Rhipicephalus microplus]